MNTFLSHKTLTSSKTLFCVLVLCVFSFQAFAQDVSFKNSRDTIKIGEQIDYTIEVSEVSDKDVVTFPKDQTFVPLEMVEDLKIDTTNLEAESYKLSKIYKLTQFDSGRYTIPPQMVKINDKSFYTDSLKIQVNDVVVDTTKQKLYPVKPNVPFEKPFQVASWVWWTLLIILILAGLFVLFFKLKKKKDEAKRRIPPFEQAKISLLELDKSDVLESRRLKYYISELTNISRRYLEEKIEVKALEFTTKELIDALKLKKSQRKLHLKDKMIEDFEKILQRADLAKFANIKPDVITLKSDRKNIERFIKQVQSSIPEPTYEERKKDKAFQEELAKKRKKQKWIIGGVLFIVLLIAGTASLVATKGFDYVQDKVFGNPTKEILEGEWITSGYGTPSVQLTTPDVLTRTELDTNAASRDEIASEESFMSGSLYKDLYVIFSQIKFKENREIDLDKAVDGIYKNLENKGAYNIISKTEDFKTINGVEGVKVFGSFAIENPITKEDIKKEYQILNFSQGGYQQITIIHKYEDEYANKIAKRIIDAVEFKKSKK
ncbi:MAG: BatD family protein [Psychroflexus sp.]